MSSTKNLRLARFLKVLMDILFGLMIFAIVALVLWVALSPVIFNQAEFIGSASIPVRIGMGSEPQFEVAFNGTPGERIGTAHVEEAEGTLFLETDSLFVIAIANAAKLIFAIGLAYVFYLMRGILKSIDEGDPFTFETRQRIRRLGYAVLAVSLLGPGAQWLAAMEILNQLPKTVPELMPGPTYNSEVILVSLLILLLAHVWSYGLDLERERELTV